MKNLYSLRYKRLSILGAVSLTTFMFGCSSPSVSSKGETVILGSFISSFDATTKTVKTEALIRDQTGKILGKRSLKTKRGLLDWADSVLINQTLVTVEDCSSSNWNGATKVLSNNFRITNTSSETILTPVEFRLTGIFGAGYSANPNIVDEVNTDLPGAACENPLRLTGSGNCDANADGNFDIIWPYEDPLDYSNDPGWDFSLLLGQDNRLSPAESSSCAFLQFSDPSAQSFSFSYDVLGKVQSQSIAAPTVAAVTTPTNDSSPNITVTLSTTCTTPATDPCADTVRIIGGNSAVTCTDGQACDLNATSGLVTVDYPLNQNQSNTLSIFQQDANSPGSPFRESAATTFSVVHDSLAPAIVSITPPHNSTNVSPSGNILISFDGALEAASVNTTNVLLNRDGGNSNCSTFGTAAARTVSQPTASEILIDPSSNLQQNAIYCIRVVGLTGGCDGSNEIRDAATNCLASTSTYLFTTSSSDSTAPSITAVYPQDGASSVSLNSPIQIVFNESILSSTITSTSFVLQTTSGGVAVTGTRTVSSDGKTITLTPSSNLASSTSYTIRATTSITDLAGNALAQNFTSYFTSGSVADSTAPTIVSFYPSDQSTNVNENIRPQISFSEPMRPSTITNSSIHLEKKSDSTPISASVSLSADGLTATITPLSALQLSTTYLISVEYSCEDFAGNNLASPQTAEFTTQSSSDTTAPTVVSLVPADNAADVGVYTGAVVAFSEAIHPNTVHTGTFILENLETTPATAVSGTVAVAEDGLSATFTQLNAPLEKNKNYRVTVKGGSSGCTTCIKDLAGNPIASNSTSTFTTRFQDNTTTRVIGTAPGANVTGVALNDKVVVTFSDPLLASSVADSSAYLTIPPSTTHVAGSLRLLSDGINVRFTPTSSLTANTTYRINITTGVKELSGNSVTAYTSDFTTSASLDATGPLLLSATSDSTSLALSTPYTTAVKRWPSIRANFDDEIDPSTVNILNNVQLIRNNDSSKVPMTLSMSADAKSVVINPVNLLDNLTSYTVNLKTGLQNLAGYPLQSFSTFQFTTADTSSDTTAPRVTAVSPANGSTNQSSSVVVTITLSEPVDPDRIINGNVSVIPQGGNSPPKGDVTISLNSTRTIITITPLTAYQNNTTYVIRLKPVIVDDANNALSCSTSSVGSCNSPSYPTDWISTFRT